ERDRWEKINSARKLLFGLTHSLGRSVYEALSRGEDAIPNFLITPAENLVFQGGGSKGLAYIGVVETLEERGDLQCVKRVAGTSAGAITATLVALGCSSTELNAFLTEEQLTDVLV